MKNRPGSVVRPRAEEAAKAPTGQESCPSEGRQGRENRVSPDGGQTGPVRVNQSGVTAHEGTDARDETRNDNDEGRALPMGTAAVRLPESRQGKDAEAEPQGYGVRGRVPCPAVICKKDSRGERETAVRQSLPEVPHPAPNLACKGAGEEHMP